MFFILSKAAALLLPSNDLILLGLVGVAMMATRFKRAGRWMAVASLLLLAAAGFLPIGHLLLHQLESRFPPWDPTRGAPDGIIVLGGDISPRMSLDYGDPVISGEGGRVIALAKLARAYPNARVVYTGGDASLFGKQYPESEFLNPLLDAFGVPRERLIAESRSRNTAENAAFSKELVQPKPGERWLLVTTAWHMPRAVGCFRQVGFDVEAYPVGWQTRRHFRFAVMDRVGNGLERLDAGVHEWAGLLTYWLSGRTSELLPGPLARR